MFQPFRLKFIFFCKFIKMCRGFFYRYIQYITATLFANDKGKRLNLRAMTLLWSHERYVHGLKYEHVKSIFN